jgi:hypothetical protein
MRSLMERCHSCRDTGEPGSDRKRMGWDVKGV